MRSEVEDATEARGQSLSGGQLALVYGLTDLDGSQPDAWRYMIDSERSGEPLDVREYR